jgi:hypothetical protein
MRPAVFKRFQVMRSAPGFAATVVLLCAGLARPACAKQPVSIDLTLKDHRFVPARIEVPSGTPVELTIHNQDASSEEFDSAALKVEQVIPGGTAARVRLRPLGPGSFPFEGEYHADTAQGAVISR